MEQTMVKQIPLARYFPVSDLEGRFNKYLEVPTNRTGFMYSPMQDMQTFQPGKHRIRSFGERITQVNQDLICGFMPSGRFSVLIQAPYLSSRDGVLLDMELVCRVTVQQNENFFTKTLLPVGEILDEPLHADEDDVRRIFSTISTQYDWIDLVRGYDIDQLIELMFPRLPNYLESRGMNLVSVDVVVFSRSDQREERAQKSQVLKAEVEDLGGEPSEKSRENFFEQLKEKLPEGFRFRQKEDVELIEQIRHLDPGEKQQTGSKRRGLFGKLFGGNRSEEGILSKDIPKYWWVQRTVWILILLSIGVFLTIVTMNLSENIQGIDFWNFLLAGVWGVNIPMMLNNLNRMVEKREKLTIERWLAPGSVSLDELVGKDRQKADGVVREHCSDQLVNTVNILHDLRARVYKENDTEKVLRIRTLERKIGDASEQVRSGSFGSAFYLNDVQISRQTWHKLLDYDEDLMLYSNAIFDASGLVQLAFPDRGLDDKALNELERQLDLFMTKFVARSRALKS